MAVNYSDCISVYTEFILIPFCRKMLAYRNILETLYYVGLMYSYVVVIPVKFIMFKVENYCQRLMFQVSKPVSSII